MSLPITSIERPTQVRFGVLGFACALSMITYLDRVCFGTVASNIQSEFGLSESQKGWLFGAFAFAYAIFEVPSGWLGDRFGARKMLARIVLGWSLFTALTGAAWNLASLVTFRFLFGLGEAGAYPNIARALRSWFPIRQRGLAQGSPWVFGRWGGAVAPFLIYYCAAWFGWRGAFLVFGLVGAAWVVGFYVWFRDLPREHPHVNEAELALIEEGIHTTARPAPLSWSAMLRSPTLWCLSLMYYCSNAGWCFFITWDVVYFKEVLNLSGYPLLIASGGPLFFGGLGCMFGGLCTDRQVRVWGRRWGRTLQGFVAYGLGALFFVLALEMTHAALAIAALCLASFFKDFAMPVSWSTCVDIGHRYSGTVSGFMNMVGNLGTVVSPPLVAWLVSVIGAPEVQLPAWLEGTRPFVTGLADLARAAGITSWKVALVYSVIMFLIASFCWMFINPRRVIVYAPHDRQRLQAEGALE